LAKLEARETALGFALKVEGHTNVCSLFTDLSNVLAPQGYFLNRWPLIAVCAYFGFAVELILMQGVQ